MAQLAQRCVADLIPVGTVSNIAEMNCKVLYMVDVRVERGWENGDLMGWPAHLGQRIKFSTSPSMTLRPDESVR